MAGGQHQQRVRTQIERSRPVGLASSRPTGTVQRLPISNPRPNCTEEPVRSPLRLTKTNSRCRSGCTSSRSMSCVPMPKSGTNEKSSRG